MSVHRLLCVNIKIFCSDFSVSILRFFAQTSLSQYKVLFYIETAKSAPRFPCLNIKSFAVHTAGHFKDYSTKLDHTGPGCSKYR